MGLMKRKVNWVLKAEDHALAVVPPNAVCDERGAVADNSVDSDFVVGGVDDQIRDLGKRTAPPFFELSVELFVEVRHLAGRHLEPAHLFHDSGDTAAPMCFSRSSNMAALMRISAILGRVF